MITLIADDPTAHGVLDEARQVRRRMPCEVASVGRSELYAAKSVGLEPSLVAILPYDGMYKDEKRCEISGVLYEVIRTYTKDYSTIELTLQAVKRNAGGEHEPV